MFGIGKWKTEEWQGEVIDKSAEETAGDDYEYTTYYLQIKMLDGQVVRKSYDHKFWSQFEIGDQIVKRPGEKKPTKGQDLC